MKIFTGYAWRDITPDRLVDEMTDEAKAGDVYEEEAE